MRHAIAVQSFQACFNKSLAIYFFLNSKCFSTMFLSNYLGNFNRKSYAIRNQLISETY